MKKLCFILLCISCFSVRGYCQQDLNGVTFGFGAGYNNLQDDMYSYTLSPDASHTLQQQILTRGSFVISSMVSVKLGKLKIDSASSQLKSGHKKSNNSNVSGIREYFFDRLAINAEFDLVELKSSDISFNKNISGGLGIGYFVAPYMQVAIFYDFQSVRQLQDYVIKSYVGKPVPNAGGFYNALDINDNTLFYNKTFSSISFKVIFSIANKKTN